MSQFDPKECASAIASATGCAAVIATIIAELIDPLYAYLLDRTQLERRYDLGHLDAHDYTILLGANPTHGQRDAMIICTYRTFKYGYTRWLSVNEAMLAIRGSTLLEQSYLLEDMPDASARRGIANEIAGLILRELDEPCA